MFYGSLHLISKVSCNSDEARNLLLKGFQRNYHFNKHLSKFSPLRHQLTKGHHGIIRKIIARREKRILKGSGSPCYIFKFLLLAFNLNNFL